ncbi:MAG: DUF3999 family protein [Xanthomonadales bacterium]|nr:DUF3999 family protein [Xanthomonadales bacterium]
MPARRNLMKLPISLPALVCLLVVAGAAAQDAPEVPDMSDYAWGFPVLADQEASFHAVELPLEVYQSVSDSLLRDAGIFNADGVPVPRVFRPNSKEVEQKEQLKSLPMIPLFENSEGSEEAIQLLFEREGDRARVEFNSEGLQEQGSDEALVAYIVDTRPLENAIRALDLSWDAVETGFIGRITVEGSNNLQDWREVGSGAVADLSESDARVLQRRVKLRKSQHDYLRIRWQSLPQGWRLNGVEAMYSTGVTRVVRNFITLQASSQDADDGGRIFDLGGSPEVDRIRILPTRPNSVVTATVYHWSERRQDWQESSSGTHYHIGQGDEVVMSSPVAVNRVRSGRFKVVINRGQPDAPLQLELGWRPDRLIFLAQGASPYTLAAGRAAAAGENFPMHSVYADNAIVRLSSSSGRASAASLGPRYLLGGPEHLQAGDVMDMRKMALWIGLILAVAFVGFMAVKVTRELKAS